MNDPVPTGPEPAWDAIGRAIDAHHRFLVTTHVNPDGDGLGAELGLWAYLRSLGKDARIVNQDPVGERYAFLDDEGQFEVYDPGRHDALIADREVVFVLDISRVERLGALGETVRAAGALTICIDHHPFEGNGLADLYGVDVEAAATGQLVFELIRARGHALDERMATGFYVSILTDTGSFRFSNSDSRAHRAAAELLAFGLKPSLLYERVYGNWSLGRLRLLGEVLRRMEVEAGGAILLLPIPHELVVSCGADPEDSEGFVDVARSARTCRAVALLLEKEDGTVKVSLRSKGELNVNRIAVACGGGGHLYASGATLEGPLERATDRVRELLVREAAASPGASR